MQWILRSRPDGSWVKTAGLAFVKQRPGTASGVVFIGVADETGDFRIFVAPDFFEQNRSVIQRAKFIGVEGPIQKEGPIIHVMARSIYELSARESGWPSQGGHLMTSTKPGGSGRWLSN